MKSSASKILNFVLLFIMISSCDMNQVSKPSPKKVPFELTQHNDRRIDNYYWIRDDERNDPEVIQYLESENAYADAWFKSKHDYKSEIVTELMAQVPDEEISFPVKNGDFKYFRKIQKNDQLPKYFRTDAANKTVMYLDPNIKLRNQKYYSIGSVSPSPDNNLIAFTEDNNGRRQYDIKFLDPITLDITNPKIDDASGNIIWSKNNKHIVYLKKDPETLISNSVYVHTIGTSSSKDKLIYQEIDPEYNIDISRSKSKKFVYINVEATNDNEIYLVDLDDPIAKPMLFLKRSTDHLYYLEHVDGEIFYVRTNINAPNFKVLKVNSLSQIDLKNADVIVEHNENIFISDLLSLENTLILEIRENGLPEIEIVDISNQQRNRLEYANNAYNVFLNSNNTSDQNGFYFNYSSLTSPSSIYYYNFLTNKQEIKWEKNIFLYDKKNYVDDRFFIEARDGVKVPVMTLRHKDTIPQNAPILFYGYGSYGISQEARFRETLIPLLNRGFIFAVINIRGGGEMGKHWYENGRMFEKMNTFYDFNDGVREVLKKGLGDPKNVYAQGGSAGGLLMGAIINLEPELYKGILAGVPFVDVLTTMSDPSIPLTTFEYDEWGNPNNKDEYFYMKQYSPYDNIKELNYPAVFVTSSLFDSQVQYFEPAKYVPKLRDYSQSKNPILMKMNLIGGHGGLSGKINQFNEVAEEYNFIINLLE